MPLSTLPSKIRHAINVLCGVDSSHPPQALPDPAIAEEWLSREHVEINPTKPCEFEPGRLVRIEPDVAALVRTLQYNAWINKAASEPRWEVAHTPTGAMAFGANPNETYRRCALLVAAGRLR